MSVIIVTPRPPLNLFEAVRLNIGSDWVTVYEVPIYRVPASGPSPQRDVATAAIMTGLTITNTSGALVDASVRIIGVDTLAYPVIEAASVPSNDFMIVSFERQVMLSNEKLQVKLNTAQTGTVHFTFILNTKEEYEVIV